MPAGARRVHRDHCRAHTLEAAHQRAHWTGHRRDDEQRGRAEAGHGRQDLSEGLQRLLTRRFTRPT
jgi:hypothetical protein